MKWFMSSMMFRGGIAALIVLVTLDSATSAQTFTTFDAPNAISTQPTAMNPAGDITGSYTDADGNVHGFLRQSDGSFTVFETGSHCFGTRPTSINPAGEIVGYCITPDVSRSFLRKKDGTIIFIDVISSSLQAPVSIMPGLFGGDMAIAINPAGEVAGERDCYGLCRGYLWHRDGSFTVFDAVSYAESGLIPFTWVQAMNSEGQITGYCNDLPGISGFLRKKDGTIIRFNVLGLATFPTAIGAGGQIAGYYSYNSFGGVGSGFLRKTDGTIITFDPIGSGDTRPIAMNSKGQIAGYYLGPDNLQHGFVRNLDATIVTFDAPDAGTAINGGTFPQAISPSGQITGYYQDKNLAVHGFIWSLR